MHMDNAFQRIHQFASKIINFAILIDIFTFYFASLSDFRLPTHSLLSF